MKKSKSKHNSKTETKKSQKLKINNVLESALSGVVDVVENSASIIEPILLNPILPVPSVKQRKSKPKLKIES